GQALRRPSRRTNPGNACLMPAKLKIAVLGATGYSGLELTRILLRHPQVEKPLLLRRAEIGNEHAPPDAPVRAGVSSSPDHAELRSVGRVGATVPTRSIADETTPNLADIFPALSGNGGYPLQPLSWESLKTQNVELLFLATPHDVSRSLVPEAISNGI